MTRPHCAPSARGKRSWIAALFSMMLLSFALVGCTETDTTEPGPQEEAPVAEALKA